MNPTLVVIISIISIISLAVLVLAELHRDLMMLQQNSYRNERYYKWLRTSGDTTAPLRLIAMALLLYSFTAYSVEAFTLILLSLIAIFMSINLILRKYKKPLVFTARAKRIYAVAILLAMIVVAIAIVLGWYSSYSPLYMAAVALLGVYCASHIVMLFANWLLSPVQRAINARYYNQAKAMLRSVPDIKVVGITGSYGKTSTKHYLYEILSEEFETLMTPGSFNTTLGVVRTIREGLKPYHQVFIAEMGAKQKGDVKEICDLVDPQIGIITSVGPQHLETFGSIENVQRTKFELVDALPSDGLAVVNNDSQMCKIRNVDNVAVARYAIQGQPGADEARYIASDITYTPEGTTFTITDKNDGSQLHLSTRLVGRCNISNLMAAVIVAMHLGMSHKKIQNAVRNIQQVLHRLNMKKTSGDVTIIDDAYNSNPEGSAMAVEVLSSFSSGKRIIVTPGMIELGEQQEEQNRIFGQNIARGCDVAIIVGKYNRNAILDGINSVDDSPTRCQIVEVDSFNKAQQHLATILQPGDVVLYENDLPDTFK